MLIPFRLPISVLFIKLMTSIASLAGSLPYEVLLVNVIITKVIYDCILATIIIYNIEHLSRDLLGRRAQENPYETTREVPMYYWTVLIGLAIMVYIGFDIDSTHTVFEYFHNRK